MKRKTLPPIPATLPSILGPVPVARVAGLRNASGEECLGIWRGDERDVRLRTDAEMALTQAWQTYWHEWAHIVLSDGAVHPELTEAMIERICDAFGNARTRELLDAR